MAIQIVTGKPGEGMTLSDSAARFLRTLPLAQRRAFLAGFALAVVLSQPGQQAPSKPL